MPCLVMTKVRSRVKFERAESVTHTNVSSIDRPSGRALRRCRARARAARHHRTEESQEESTPSQSRVTIHISTMYRLRVPTLILVAARAAHSLSTTRILDVALPKLPSGGELVLYEGLEDATDGESPESLEELFSVGGTVWPCAAALCRWLDENRELVQGANILELGSGTGACGLFAAASGAARVVMTDSTPRLLRLMENNCERNKAAGNLPGLGSSTFVSFETLLWNSSPNPSGPFELIIGSDCTYEFDEESHTDLAATLDALLAASSAPRIVLAHQHRNRSPGQAIEHWDDEDEPLQSFQVALERHQLEAHQLVWERPAEGSSNALLPLEGEDEISIIEVLRRA